MVKEVISQAHIKQIGRLVVAVSKIESLLTDIIAALMKIHPLLGIAVVDHQQASSKIDSLLAICDLFFAGEKAEKPLMKIIGRAKPICEFRNTVVHASWFTDKKGTAYAVRFSARGEIKRTRTPYTAAQIQRRADEAFELIPIFESLRGHFRKG